MLGRLRGCERQGAKDYMEINKEDRSNYEKIEDILMGAMNEIHNLNLDKDNECRILGKIHAITAEMLVLNKLFSEKNNQINKIDYNSKGIDFEVNNIKIEVKSDLLRKKEREFRQGPGEKQFDKLNYMVLVGFNCVSGETIIPRCFIFNKDEIRKISKDKKSFNKLIKEISIPIDEGNEYENKWEKIKLGLR